MNLPDIPESISVDRLVELVTGLGIDHEHVLDVTLEPDTVTVRRFATDANGDRFARTSWTPGTGTAITEVAVDTIVIPVDRGPAVERPLASVLLLNEAPTGGQA